MDNKSFDNILRNSMETPRDIPFDEGAWSRMAKQLPDEPSKWGKWRKFVPFILAILALMAWNICLQQQMNQMKYLTYNKVQRDTIFQKKLVYQIDTIYQVVEKVKKIYIINEENKTRKAIAKRNFVYKNNFPAFSQSKDSDLNSNFLKSHLSIGNGYNITPSLQLTPNNYFNQSDYKSSSEAFFTKKDHSNAVNPADAIPIAEKTTDITTKKIGVTELERLPIQKIKTWNRINMDDEINWCNLYQPIVSKKPLIGLSEFKIGISNNTVSAFGANVAASLGLHLGASISLNWTIELDFSEASGISYLRPSGLYLNSYPYVDHDLIPSHYQLQAANLSGNYYQFAVAFRRIWFKKEHIRPYAEVGLMGYKLYKGTISYHYGVVGESSFSPMIDLNSMNYEMGWETPVFISAGLSTALFRRKMSLDVGVRYMRNFNSQFSLYEGETADGIGLNVGLNYHF